MFRTKFKIAALLMGIGLPLIPCTGAQQPIPTAVPAAAPQTAPPEVAQITGEAQGWLTDLIRINTTNPPGNEMEAAKYVAAVLQK